MIYGTLFDKGGNNMKKYDLIVAGGGLTGVAAAVSAAREGLQVLLVERMGCLSGAMANSLVYPFMIFWMNDPETGKRRLLSAGLFTEMRERMSAKTGFTDMELKPEYFKLVLDDMVTEAGVDVLFHAAIFDVMTENDKVKSLKLVTKSGVIEVEAEFFVDATGDGDVFAMAGCEFALGRESDGLCQPMTTCFRLSNVDLELFKKERPRLQELYKEWQAEGKITNPRENILVFYGIGDGILHLNTTRVIRMNPIDVFDVSKAEIEARRQVYEMEQFLKANCEAFKNSTIISIASDIGVRESRKLIGEHVLTAEELKNCTPFEDSIAIGNYEIDIHNPNGTGTELYYFKPGEYYQIPYRSLLPKEFTNLLVAGRCISATHEAQAAVRIMPICSCLGEAAGTAIGVAFNSGSNTHTVDVKEVQRKLTENGAEIF